MLSMSRCKLEIPVENSLTFNYSKKPGILCAMFNSKIQ